MLKGEFSSIKPYTSKLLEWKKGRIYSKLRDKQQQVYHKVKEVSSLGPIFYLLVIFQGESFTEPSEPQGVT